MAFEVILPRQGQSVDTCLILEWTAGVGKAVSEGDPLCRVETDKAVFDVEAPRTGTLLKIFFQEGEDVSVLSTLALIGEPGEDVSAYQRAGSAAPEAAAAPAREAAQPGDAQARPAGAFDAARGETGAVSPRARRLAERLGLETAGLAGSGPGGRIIECDVRRRAAEGQPLTPAARARLKDAAGALSAPRRGGGIGGRVRAEDLLPAAEEDPYTDLSLTPTRRRIAERMLESLRDSAQYTLHAWADAEGLLAARKTLKSSLRKEEAAITLNDLILCLAAGVLRRFPELNSHFLGDRVRRFQRVHLGFAVDTDRGLLVPVIRGADRLGPEALSREAWRLTAACREGRAAPEELSGGTFTVSNLGGLGVEQFTPVLNPPQVGILGVGRIALRPVESGGEVRFARSLPLSLTANHQVLDGMPAARFLEALCAAIAAFRYTEKIEQKERE